MIGQVLFKISRLLLNDQDKAIFIILLALNQSIFCISRIHRSSAETHKVTLGKVDFTTKVCRLQNMQMLNVNAINIELAT
jgi:hypothetical protein